MIALLIRHADTAAIGRMLWGRRPGLPLSDAGAAQARRLPGRLDHCRLSAIYASPRERARQTAAPLALARRLPIVETDAIDEVDFGDWTGRTLAELDQMPEWHVFNSDRAQARAPGGERLSDVQTRVVAQLARLAARHGPETIAIISHAEPIRSAVLHYLELPLDAFQRIEISPASITVLALDGQTATFLSLNDSDRP